MKDRRIASRINAPLLALLMATLTGISTAQAATVQVVGTVATGITGLEVGSAIYNVSFTYAATHDEWPAMLDVTSIEDAKAVMYAIGTELDNANITAIRYTSPGSFYDHNGATIWYGSDTSSLFGQSITASGGWSTFVGASNAPLNNSRPFAVDLNPVPVPAAVWLFGSAVFGLVGLAKSRKG